VHVQRLHLEEFRVYRILDLEIPAAGIRIVGPNGSGKSSVVEAISLLSTTRSQRTVSDRELIRWGSGVDYGVPPYARCQGEIDRSDGPAELEISLEAEAAPVNEDRDLPLSGTVRKRCLLGGRPVRALDVIGRLRTVSFSPEDVAVVSGPPGARRRLIDIALSQVDRRYLQALSRYGRVMSQRNGLLKSFARDNVVPGSAAVRSQLTFWDDQLIEAGAVVVAGRRRYVESLSGLAAARYAQLAGGARFSASYTSNVLKASPLAASNIGRPSSDGDEAEIAAVADQFRAQLTVRHGDEIRRGITLVGPHRDDLRLDLEGTDLAIYGSRGQQRLGILALKLAEADAMVSVGDEPPVLLLDDVLSELDPERGRLLLETIAGFSAQIVVTATDRASLDVGILRGLPLVQTGAGTIRL
jgi:DNA replication and repair protein RecF